MQYIIKTLFFVILFFVSSFASKISIGDNIYVESWPVNKYSAYVVVNRDSSIVLPYYKKPIKIAGLELLDASKELNKTLQKYFRDINFVVKFAGVTTIKINIVGAVVDPGEYLFPSGSRLSSIVKKLDLNRLKTSKFNTISAYNPTLIDNSLSQSENLDNSVNQSLNNQFTSVSNDVYNNSNDEQKSSIDLKDGVSLRNIKIIRGDSSFIVDLKKFFLTGNTINNPEIFDGDIIKFKYKKSSVYLKGAINSPGVYEIKNGETLKDIVEFAGGLCSSADSSKIYIYNTQKKMQYVINYSMADSVKLHNFDHVYIEYYKDLIISREVKITGAVAKPGLYPIDSNSTLRTIIKRAGGISRDGFLLGIKIRRYVGPISGPFIPSWRKDYINLSVIDGDTVSLDSKLVDGDEIYVPVATNHVYVMGYVGKPGSFTYIKGKSAKYYLKLAGGKNSFAYNGMIRVIKNKNGKILKLWSVKEIEKGDVIYVPQYVPFVATPGWRVFKDVIIILSAAVGIMSSSIFTQYVLGN